MTMRAKLKRRILSVLLTVCLVQSMYPTTVFAVENSQNVNASGLCEHHRLHTADCGYTEELPEAPCTHEHTDECSKEAATCVHEHTADCYDHAENTATDSDALKSVNCEHICDEAGGCITTEPDCPHSHDEDCGYGLAVPGTPCLFACEECAALALRTERMGAGDIEINTENFPDWNFRKHLKDQKDTDKDGFLSAAEIASVRQLVINQRSIASLAGIEYFTGLNDLFVQDNVLTELPDLPDSLTTLNCSNNLLTELPALPTGLGGLNCKGNRLTGSLNVGSLNKLELLNCSGNELTGVALNGSAPYATIDVSYNMLADENDVTGKSIAWGTAGFVFEPQENMVAPPVFLPEAGTYQTAQSVTITSATEDAAIHYTTDGTTPTESSTAYTGAITVDSTTTIKAIAVKNEMTTSAVTTAQYTIGYSDIAIDENNFPDAEFRTWLLDEKSINGAGKDGKLTAAEIANIKTINVFDRNIADLTGIAYFTALINLTCSTNQLTALPTLPTGLTALECRNNRLTELPELPPRLTILICTDNQLSGTLNVSGQDEIKSFYCDDNNLTGVVLSDSAPYQNVDVSNNLLADESAVTGKEIAWDVGNFKFSPQKSTDIAINEQNFPDDNFRAWLLEESNINGAGKDGKLTAAEIANIKKINVFSKNIADLTGIAHFTALMELVCSDNRLMELPELPTGLTSLDCGANQLTELPALPTGLSLLACGSNQLTKLPELPTGLTSLKCRNNRLAELPKLPTGLATLECGANQLTELPKLPTGLEVLECGGNQLTALPELPIGLISLDCSGNRLMALPELPTGLTALYCNNNRLSGTLNVSGQNEIKSFYCRDNSLTGVVLNGSAPYQNIDVSNNRLAGKNAVTGKEIAWDVGNFKFSPQKSGITPVFTSADSFECSVNGGFHDLAVEGFTPTGYSLSGNVPNGVRIQDMGKGEWMLMVESDVEVGVHSFIITATDGNTTITQNFTLTVKAYTATVTVTTADGLKAALESNTPSTINVTENITLKGSASLLMVAMGADHTLDISAGKTLAIGGGTGNNDAALINLNNHTLTVTGGSGGTSGKVLINNYGSNGIYGNPGTLNLENVQVEVTNSIQSGLGNIQTLNIKDGATVTLNGDGIQMMRLNDGQTAMVESGGTITITKHGADGIALFGGELHINGGAVHVNSSSGAGIYAGSGTLKLSSGTLDGTGTIYLHNGCKVEGLSGKFTDRGTPFTASGTVTVGRPSVSPAANGLTQGVYTWDGSNTYEKSGYTVSGTVKDSSGAGISGAAVTLEYVYAATPYVAGTATTNVDGSYTFSNISASFYSTGAGGKRYDTEYRIKASKDGYAEIAGELFSVADNDVTGEDITLTAGGTTTYPIGVINGTASPTTAAQGATVTLTANAAQSSDRFKEWVISPAVTFTDGTSKTSATAKFIMPGQAVSAAATYEASPSVTGTMDIGGTAVSDLTQDATGTGWTWMASNATLALVKDYTGAPITINCQSTDTINLSYAGDVALTSSSSSVVACTGNLNITGSGGALALNCTSTSSQYCAIEVSKALTIAGGAVLNATYAGSGTNPSAVAIYGAYGVSIRDNASVTANTTGNDASGIWVEWGNLTIDTTGKVAAKGGGTGGALAIHNGRVLTMSNGSLELSGTPLVGSSFADLNVTGGNITIDGTAVYRALLTLSGVNAMTKVTAVSKPAAGYGMSSELTSEDGKLCFLLPAGSQTVTLTADGKTYTGTVNVTSNHAATATLTTGSTPTTYAVNVTNGTASLTTAAQGATVTLTANATPDGQRFKEWTITPSVTFADGTSKTSATAKIIMPGQAVTATATYENIPATVTSVTVSPATANVQKGTAQQFGVSVQGTNNPAQTVTWTVSGNAKAGTSITSGGLLTVAPDETAGTLTVTATSTVAAGKSGTATVTVTADAVTKYQLTVTNGSGTGSYEAGASVTVTANAPAVGQRFKAWTATGMTGVALTANPLTFEMPAGEVTLTAAYEDISVDTSVIDTALDAANAAKKDIVTSDSSASSVAKGMKFVTTAEMKALNDAISAAQAAKGTVTTTAQAQAAANTLAAATAVFKASIKTGTYTSGGGSSSGDGSSSGGNTIVTPPSTPDQPYPPATAETKIPPTVDASGNASVSVLEKSVTDAIKAAQDAAKKAGTEKNGISVIIDATTTGRGASSISATLPVGAVDALIKAGVTEVKIKSDAATMTLDLATLKAAQAAAGGAITVSAAKQDVSKLSAAAQAAIGNRPAFSFTLTSGGKPVSNFGGGTATISIPYAPQKGEDTGKLGVVYVDDNGGVTYLRDSSYDPNTKSMIAKTGHFSVFGVGYKTDAPQFTDTATHWAKNDIDFVAARGLLSGTGNNQFSPDTSVTRGMFVTALGRLAGMNPDSYKTGKFTDVKADAYYATYVNWAADKGIVNGTSDTTFAPDQAVTRQEMAVIMANYAKAMSYTVPKTRAAVTFADNSSIASWAAEAVKSMQMAGVVSGKAGNRFDPIGTATRAEVAAVLHRYVELVIDPATAQGWTQNDVGQWLYYENGKPVTGWKLVDGKWYYLDSAGLMQSSGWKQIGGKWYYLYADGSMAVDTKIDGYEVGAEGARKGAEQ